MRKRKEQHGRSLGDQIFRKAVAMMLLKESRMSYRQIVNLHWDQLKWPNIILTTRTPNAREVRASRQLVEMINALPYEHDRLVFFGDSPFADIDTFSIKDNNPAFTEQNRTELIRSQYSYGIYEASVLQDGESRHRLRLPKLTW